MPILESFSTVPVFILLPSISTRESFQSQVRISPDSSEPGTVVHRGYVESEPPYHGFFNHSSIQHPERFFQPLGSSARVRLTRNLTRVLLPSLNISATIGHSVTLSPPINPTGSRRYQSFHLATLVPSLP